ncbi:hypothetical protein [Pelagibius marinus]|uniref:hypothetical protein n=1 Tax=Pelagibius marinus TaxID=2762760 RepID=UPI001872C853|nr:hypothetical protein [Pelagibius marinus]
MLRGTFHALVLAAVLATLPQAAEAYIGPGAGISAIGTVVALLGALALMIVGFVWYPIKRLRRKMRAEKEDRESPSV